MKVAQGWRRVPVVFGKNGRIKPHVVLVDGVEEVHLEGQYQLKFYEGSDAKYKSVGNDATDALAARDQHIHLLTARAAAERAGITQAAHQERLRLSEAYSAFLAIVRLRRRSQETSESYRLALKDFVDGCGKRYVDEIDGADLLRYMSKLRDRGLSDRTAYNRHGLVRTFLRQSGLDVKKRLLGKSLRVSKTKRKCFRLSAQACSPRLNPDSRGMVRSSESFGRNPHSGLAFTRTAPCWKFRSVQDRCICSRPASAPRGAPG